MFLKIHKTFKSGDSSMQNAPREHSAILSTCIKRLPVLKTNLSSFEWLFKTGLTVIHVFHL